MVSASSLNLSQPVHIYTLIHAGITIFLFPPRGQPPLHSHDDNTYAGLIGDCVTVETRGAQTHVKEKLLRWVHLYVLDCSSQPSKDAGGGKM